MGMIQETVEAKSEVALPLEKDDAEMVDRLGLHGISLAFACVRRGIRGKQKVQRIGRWLPPSHWFFEN